MGHAKSGDVDPILVAANDGVGTKLKLAIDTGRSGLTTVDVDVSACAEEEHRVFPDEQISVTPSRAAIVLSGHVSTEDVAKRAGDLASAIGAAVRGGIPQ